MNDWFIPRIHREPIPAPTIDPDFDQLNPPQRVVESIRFFVLSSEHWLSSDGLLRAWLRATLRIFCPLLAILPTITFVLWQMALWAGFLVTISKSIVIVPLAVLAAIILIKLSVRMLGGH